MVSRELQRKKLQEENQQPLLLQRGQVGCAWKMYFEIGQLGDCGHQGSFIFLV